MDYDAFYKEYINFNEIQSKQRARGLNDYNIFTSLLSYSDEVRLHSRFIFSLINPEGTHYQGTLFLELFLKAIGLSDIQFNLSLAKVYKEHNKEIDLYITDGDKHIIIENKIFAGDQQGQISRYIKTIKKENKNYVSSNIYVIYLSLNRKQPSKQSFIGYTISDEKWLIDKNKKKINFKAVYYNVHVKEWLLMVGKEVSNLSNLYQVVIQYMDVVEKLYNEHKDKCMSLQDFIGTNVEKWDMLNELADNRDRILLNKLNDISKDLLSHIKGKSKSGENIERCEVISKNGEMYKDFVYINFHLLNNVIIQMYYNMEFTLKKIEVQFHLSNQDKKGYRINPNIDRFICESISEFVCDSNLQRKWIKNHGESFFEQFDDLINDLTNTSAKVE